MQQISNVSCVSNVYFREKNNYFEYLNYIERDIDFVDTIDCWKVPLFIFIDQFKKENKNKLRMFNLHYL